MMPATVTRKVFTVIGACLVLAPNSLPGYWGSLATYVYSYYSFHAQTAASSQFTWVLSTYFVARTLTLICSGPMMQCLGQQLTILCGVVAFNVGLFSSYFAIQYSMTLFIFTIGGLCGIGTGLVYGPTIELSLQWKDQGFALSIIQGAYNFGAIVINQFFTVYINPRNEDPDDTVYGYARFTQKDIVNSLPSMFLVLGATSSIFQLIGMCMMNSFCIRRIRHVEMQASEESIRASNSEKSLEIQPQGQNSERATCKSDDLSPRQILFKREFYVLWLSHFLGYFPYLIIFSYYKAFGQLFITDDHFLNFTGTGMSLCLVGAKCLSGLVCDKYGFKFSLISLFVVMSISCSLLQVTPIVNKWFYLIDVISLSGPNGAMLIAHIAAIKVLFGPKHITINTGFVSTAMACLMVSAPTFIPFLTEHGHWSVLFYTATASCVINLLLVLRFL